MLKRKEELELVRSVSALTRRPCFFGLGVRWTWTPQCFFKRRYPTSLTFKVFCFTSILVIVCFMRSFAKHAASGILGTLTPMLSYLEKACILDTLTGRDGTCTFYSWIKNQDMQNIQPSSCRSNRSRLRHTFQTTSHSLQRTSILQKPHLHLLHSLDCQQHHHHHGHLKQDLASPIHPSSQCSKSQLNLCPYRKTFLLNTGDKIAAIGLGTWHCKPNEVHDAVKVALKKGYIYIDTALAYGNGLNEHEVGRGIEDSGVPREEIWLMTKLDNMRHHIVPEGIESSLNCLGQIM